GVYQRAGDVDAALKELTSAVTKHPESWQAHALLARLFVARGESKQAIGASKKAIDLKPENASIHNLLARAYEETGEFDLALKAFNKAAELDPAMVTALLGVARMYIEQGNLVEAKRGLADLSKGSRSLMLVHRMLAEILMREGEYDDAVAEFKAAILHGEKLAENHPEVLTIVPSPGDSRKTAQAYQKVFAKIASSDNHAAKTRREHASDDSTGYSLL
ncbi:MAG TPA: tetratricopeptide repeat protein, partial [Rhodoferax sp.]|nr:tetratricopeptide repeat protein [Rhodoferax sp.]